MTKGLFARGNRRWDAKADLLMYKQYREETGERIFDNKFLNKKEMDNNSYLQGQISFEDIKNISSDEFKTVNFRDGTVKHMLNVVIAERREPKQNGNVVYTHYMSHKNADGSHVYLAQFQKVERKEGGAQPSQNNDNGGGWK